MNENSSELKRKANRLLGIKKYWMHFYMCYGIHLVLVIPTSTWACRYIDTVLYVCSASVEQTSCLWCNTTRSHSVWSLMILVPQHLALAICSCTFYSSYRHIFKLETNFIVGMGNCKTSTRTLSETKEMENNALLATIPWTRFTKHPLTYELLFYLKFILVI